MTRPKTPPRLKSKSGARSPTRRHISMPQLNSPAHLLRMRRSLGRIEVTLDSTNSDPAREWKPRPGISDVTRFGRELRNHRGVINGSPRIYSERLLALLNKYGITDANDPDRWMRLAFCLAMDYVPDFMLGPRPQGRKRSPTYFALIAEVEVTATAHGVSIHKACELLSKRDQRPWKGWDTQTIERGYYERKRQIAGDKFRMEVYEAWSLYRNQKLPDNAGVDDWDKFARQWNAMPRVQVLAKLRDLQPELARILQSGFSTD